jgi:hypothetical protein
VRLPIAPGEEDPLPRITVELLSRSQLAEIIQRPSLDLYREDRRRWPMEDIVQRMRNDIRIRRTNDSPDAIAVEFAYPDREKAKAATAALVNELWRKTADYSRYRAALWRHAWPDDPPPPEFAVSLVSPPTLPDAPLSSNRARYAAIGAAAGLGIALLLRRPARNLRLAGFAVAGAVAVAVVSFAIRDRFTSTALLRLTPAEAPKRLWNTLAPAPLDQQFQRLAAEVLAPESLEKIIANPQLRLYPKEQDRAARLRDSVRFAPAGQDAVAVSFTYTDRYKAQGAVRELINVMVDRWIAGHRSRADEIGVLKYAAERRLVPNLEIVDPATLPEAPVFPNRLAIASLGLPIGLVAGVFVLRRRSAQPA